MVSVREPVRMCVRCDRVTTSPVLVSEVHAASGPGFNVYACAECAPLIPKLPDAFDLLATGRPARPRGERAVNEQWARQAAELGWTGAAGLINSASHGFSCATPHL